MDQLPTSNRCRTVPSTAGRAVLLTAFLGTIGILFPAPASAQKDGFPSTLSATGTIEKFNYYRVIQEPMSSRKPDHIKKEPT